MYRVFGDIEDKEKLFQTVMKNLDATKSERKCIFLGDMYASNNSSQTIRQIEAILRKCGIYIVDIFNDENIHDIKFVKEQWKILYNEKHLHIYNSEYIQYFKISPLDFPTNSGHYLLKPQQKKQYNAFNKNITFNKNTAPQKPNVKPSTNRFQILSDAYRPSININANANANVVIDHRVDAPSDVCDYNQSLNSQNKGIFIFGNKDVGFVLQMIKPIRLTTNEQHELIATYHSFRHYDNKKLKTNTYNAHELNVMYTYISNCRHYYVDNNILYLHCFLNAKKFYNALQFNKIVCGHHKGFGMITHPDYVGKYVFMIDYTIIDNDSLIPQKVYFDINKSRITMVDDRFFPTPAKQCTLVSVSPNMVKDPNDDGTSRPHQTKMLNGEVIINHPHGICNVNIIVPKLIHGRSKVRHLNKLTLLHDYYSDTELMIDKDTEDLIKNKEV